METYILNNINAEEDLQDTSDIRLEACSSTKGLRLDQFLKLNFENESRAKLQSWIESSAVLKVEPTETGILANPSLTPSYKIKENDCFIVSPPLPIDLQIIEQDIPLDIIFEDKDLLVINKQAGMVVHPAPGHIDGTLVNALLFHCKNELSGINGVKRPGIVHRLDKDTSGLMVVAKNDYAHNKLATQFHPSDRDGTSKTLQRCYKALVYGALPSPSLTLEGWIGRDPKNRQRMALVKSSQLGKKAITHLRTERVFYINEGSQKLSLLECMLATGRTHQIRVHCQSVQCGLVGDPLYSQSKIQKKNLPDQVLSFKRQALHAYKLSFIHPCSDKIMTFESPIPQDFKELLECLELLSLSQHS